MRLLVIMVLLAACGAKPVMIDGRVTHGTTGGEAHDDAVTEATELFGRRLSEPLLRAAIEAWEKAVALQDDDAESYLMLARASYFLADNFLADDEHKAEMITVYEKGAAYAERGLRARFPALEQKRAAGADVDQAAVGLGPEAAPLLYWYALNLIRWADAKGWATAMNEYKKVFRIMDMVRKLDESYDHAGPDRFFGGARAQAPGIAGGSIDESKIYYQRALELAPNFLLNRVDMAHYLARKTGDRALYEASLQQVADTPAESVPDAVPEQEMAKRKARKLGAW